MGGVPLFKPLRVARKTSSILQLLLLCSQLISTSPSPLSAHGTRATLPHPLLPSNFSAFTAPTPPQDFSTEIHYDPSKRLNPLGIYLCAIECMYQFAQAGWTYKLTGGYTVWAEGLDVQLDVESSSGSHGSLGLETSHIAFGILNTMVDVAATSRFCEVLTTISLHRRQLGIFVIEKRRPRTLGNGKANITISSPPAVSSQSNAVTYPTGQFKDSEDPEFSISYTYTGARINSKGVFLAILDALATSAQFARGMSFDSLDAASAGGDCVIKIVGNDGPYKVNYSFVAKALRILIADIIVPLNKFEEMKFELEWEATVMAEASIRLANRGTVAR